MLPIASPSIALVAKRLSIANRTDPMADILLSCGAALDGTSLERRLVTTSRARRLSDRKETFAYAVARLDDPELWFPAENQRNGRMVILGGRIALSAAEWDAAERLALKGGLAARHLLNQWDSNKTGAVPTFNGAAVAVFLDPMAGIGYLRTDRIGCAPIFASISDGPLVIGSHPDSIAATLADLGRPSPLDDITMAEFVRTGTATQPYTYYRDIIQLDAAALYEFGVSGSAATLKLLEKYWSPAVLRGGAPASRGEFVEALAHGLRTAGELRSSARLGKPVVLLSAGADSRGILCALSSPAEAHAYTYYDEPNPELLRAEAIAKAAGTPHTALKRTPDYYVTNAEETVRLSGGMWSLESGHHTGFVENIWSTPNFGTLFTGCYADYLFKGIALNVKARTIFGKPLPIYKLGFFGQEFHHPINQIESSLEQKSIERFTSRFSDAMGGDDRYAIEYLRISPMCREADASGRLSFWRQFPIDPMLADNHVLDAYSIQSAKDKLSGIAFGMAIAKITGSTVARIPNNNYSAPVGSGEFGRVGAFIAASLRRKLEGLLIASRAFRPAGVATFGSWPNFRAVFRANDQARAWFDDLCCAGHYGILGPDRAAWSYDTFLEQDIVQLMRLFTVHLWRSRFAIDPERMKKCTPSL